jgi:serine/threonine protein kinase
LTGQVIDRDKLGVLNKIGQGGQGVVYQAPNVTTTFASSMVYKEYKAQALAGIDFTALAAMPALVEESLSYAQAERLISIAAWPCRIVEDASAPAGFVMPAIPQKFFIPLTTVKGVAQTTAEFQHLLNHPTVLVARGITIDDVQRCTLLREVASGLAFLHKHGVCVGDISPKNLLFSLTPHEGVYFIDCDAARINGVSALPHVETPGWEVPAGEELATIYSDTYKLGLLALRLLAGDQDTTNPGHLPATTPAMLRQIVTDTLTNEPVQRPLPEAWTYVLGHAIEETQHRQKGAPPISATPPSTPTVRSRPTVSAASAVRPQPAVKSAPPPKRQPQPMPSKTPPKPPPSPTNKPSAASPRTNRRTTWSRAVAFGVVPALALLLALGAGYLGWRDSSVRDADLARIESVQVAKDSTIALLSYRADTVDKDLGSARDLLTGDFKNSYTSLTNDVVIPGAKQKQISAVATVPAVASVSADPNHAVALVFVNQTVIVGTAAPTNSASSVKVTMDKIEGRWLVSGFDPL